MKQSPNINDSWALFGGYFTTSCCESASQRYLEEHPVLDNAKL